MARERNQTEKNPEEIKVSKTWEAAMRLKGSLIVNGLTFLL